MDWIKLKPLAGNRDRLVRASFIVEVQIKSPTDIKLIDRRGNAYGWTGTMADYAELVSRLGLAGDN